MAGQPQELVRSNQRQCLHEDRNSSEGQDGSGREDHHPDTRNKHTRRIFSSVERSFVCRSQRRLSLVAMPFSQGGLKGVDVVPLRRYSTELVTRLSTLACSELRQLCSEMENQHVFFRMFVQPAASCRMCGRCHVFLVPSRLRVFAQQF